MKKTHWLRTTLITLAACCIAGVILALVLFNANPGRTGVTSSVEFSFDGAAEGLAPNGYRYDLSGFTSDEVLEAALKDAGLEGRYTADQIRANILVSGVYPKNIVDQMTRYESVLTGDTSRVKVVDYHATLYKVTLYNDFDKSVSRADLEKLLAAVMEEFRTQFEKVYSVILAEDSLLADLDSYDYPQQLEILGKTVLRYSGYAEEMANAHPDFLLNGKGFQDIAARYRSLQDSDLERLNSLVTLNALFKDPDRIAVWYENQAKVLEIRIRELEQEEKDTESLIAQYTKDDIIYVSTTGALQQVNSSSSSTYDALVARRQETSARIADLNKELAEVRLKLSDIRGEAQVSAVSAETDGETGEAAAETEAAPAVSVVSGEEREAQKAVVETGITDVVARLNTLTEEFSALLKAYSGHEMNDRTVAVTSVKYRTPKILSAEFAVLAVKTAGPLCVLGLIACLAGLIASRRKQEKALQKG